MKIRLTTLRRTLGIAKDAATGTGLGITSGGVLGLVYSAIWPFSHIVCMGIVFGLIVSLTVGSLAGKKSARTLRFGVFPDRRHGFGKHATTMLNIHLITGGLLGVVAGTLHTTNIRGAVIGGMSGVLFGGIAALPVSLVYLLTIGLILDRVFIVGFWLLAGVCARHNLFSREEIQEFNGWRRSFGHSAPI